MFEVMASFDENKNIMFGKQLIDQTDWKRNTKCLDIMIFRDETHFFLGKEGGCDSICATKRHTRGNTYHLRGQYKSTNCPASFSILIYCNKDV